jgi:hypothetical protein
MFGSNRLQRHFAGRERERLQVVLQRRAVRGALGREHDREGGVAVVVLDAGVAGRADRLRQRVRGAGAVLAVALADLEDGIVDAGDAGERQLQRDVVGVRGVRGVGRRDAGGAHVQEDGVAEVADLDGALDLERSGAVGEGPAHDVLVHAFPGRGRRLGREVRPVQPERRARPGCVVGDQVLALVEVVVRERLALLGFGVRRDDLARLGEEQVDALRRDARQVGVLQAAPEGGVGAVAGLRDGLGVPEFREGEVVHAELDGVRRRQREGREEGERGAKGHDSSRRGVRDGARCAWGADASGVARSGAARSGAASGATASRGGGTGSKPPGWNGWHFATRTTANAPPRSAPCVRIASCA